MTFLRGITTLLIYQVVGESLVLVTQLPIPGPVLGMFLLFITLVILNKKTDEALQDASRALLSHLSLLFVPAGVGVMVYFHRIQSEWVPISVAVIGSTLLTLIVTALCMKFMLSLSKNNNHGK
jgi:holin-like protein